MCVLILLHSLGTVLDCLTALSSFEYIYIYLELEGNIEDDHRLVLQVSYCVDLTFEGYSSLKLQREIDHRIFVPCILPYKVPPPYLRKKSLVTLDHI